MSALQLAIFTDAIRLMASPAPAQIQPGQVSADEVALDWDNAWQVAEELWQEKVISTEIYHAVTQLNHELEIIKPASSFWSDEALRHDDHWENFRTRARAILEQLVNN